ncbi:acyl-CoA thioesterase [Clostridium sp.]|uniref:acyl-CoA thioesterase n=1 Tax=Clostridium sp. TaxID=1506 RepID=UPI002FDDB5AE
MKDQCKFHHTFRVRFTETDPHNHVFNGVYYTYFDTAITEYFRSLKLLDCLNMNSNSLFFVLKTSARYYQPVMFDDLIDVYVKTSHMGNSSLTFNLYVYCKNDDSLKCEGEVVWVFTDAVTQTKKSIDNNIRDVISNFEG